MTHYRTAAAVPERDTVVVTGSRDFTDKSLLDHVLTGLFYMSWLRRGRPSKDLEYFEAAELLINRGRLVHGAAEGADMMAGAWASGHGFDCDRYPVTKADGAWPWAGHRRNRRRRSDEARP